MTAKKFLDTARKYSWTATTPFISTRAQGEYYLSQFVSADNIAVRRKLRNNLLSQFKIRYGSVNVIALTCLLFLALILQYSTHIVFFLEYSQAPGVYECFFMYHCFHYYAVYEPLLGFVVVVPELSARYDQIHMFKTNQVMSELSIVLDLRLLGKMWHGTRDEQTPQPVRMTLGNKGTAHLPPPPPSVVVCQLCFGVTWALAGHSVHTESVLFSSIIFSSDSSLLCCWVTWPLGLTQSEGVSPPTCFTWRWQKVNGILLNVWTLLKQNTLSQWLWHPARQHICSYVTHLCVVLIVAEGHLLSPSVLHLLEWHPDSSLVLLADCIHNESLPFPQPDANWQQPAIGRRTRAEDLHFKEAE